MRKKPLIGLALYLACGFVFGLLTHRGSYMCPGQAEMHEYEPAAIAPEDFDLAEDAPICDPRALTYRLPWVAIATPAWLPLVVRNVARSDGIEIGNITLGH